MDIPLQNFQESINETILQRGLTYFQEGRVVQFTEKGEGFFEATVQGTIAYQVRIRLENEIVTTSSCDCPYDFGPICKHISAVIYFLMKDELEIEPKKQAKKRTSKRVEKVSPKEQLAELLKKLPHDDLKRFVTEYANADKLFVKKLLFAFAHLNENETKSYYASQLRAIIQSAPKRGGFVHARGARMIGQAVNDFLLLAQKQLDNRNHRSVILMATAALEVLTKAFQTVDDSNGDLGGGIYFSVQLLTEVAENELHKKEQKLFFDYTLNTYKKGLFQGWDWHLDMLEMASKLLRSKAEGEKVLDLLDQVKIEDSEYQFQRAQRIKLVVISKIDGEQSAEAYMIENLSNDAFREEAIRRALLKNDFQKANALSEEGLVQVTKDKPGLAWKWIDWLLKTAIQQENSERIIEHARTLFLGRAFEQEYLYDLLKQHVENRRWEDFVEALIFDLKSAKNWRNVHVIAMIYVKEQRWEDLLTLLKQQMKLGNILPSYLDDFQQYLVGNHLQTFAEIYGLGIQNYLERNVGRSYYKNACRFIRKMYKFGAFEKADALVAQLKATYKHRPSLIEELQRI